MLIPSSSLRQHIAMVLKDHEAAIDLFMLLRDVLHFWDDLIDGDHVIAHDDINRSMFKALVAIPGNAFYQMHQAQLSPVLVNAIANWQAANVFEQSDDQRLLQQAFVIRSDYANLLIQMAYLVGGYEWVTSMTPVIRSVWTSEDFHAYLNSLRRERQARASRATGENNA